MTIGYALLLALGLLIIFGVGQRVLDRMRLTDRQALAGMAAVFIGGLIPDIPLGPVVSINLGGAVLPAALCIMLVVKADSVGERWRSLAAAVAGAIVVMVIGRAMPAEPEAIPFDPNWLYGLACGIVAYLMGRSRRAALIGGVMGVLLADLTQGIINLAQGLSTPIALGSGGAMDVVVISGLAAVLTAELIGEVRERLQHGTAHTDMEYEHGDFVPVHRKGGRHGQKK